MNALTPIAIQSQEERTARQLSACQELAELGMQLARIAAQKALRDWQAEEAAQPGETPRATTRSADPSLTFVRLSLAVRQAITLEAQIAAGPEAFLRPASRSAPPRRHPAGPGRATPPRPQARTPHQGLRRSDQTPIPGAPKSGEPSPAASTTTSPSTRTANTPPASSSPPSARISALTSTTPRCPTKPSRPSSPRATPPQPNRKPTGSRQLLPLQPEKTRPA